MTDREAEESLQGEIVEPGRARIEDSDNADAWIEAEYRDGWVGRKLLGQDKEVYQEMVHPYLQQCIKCREWADTQMWGLDSPYCPSCEQYMEFVFPRLMAWVCDGESLEWDEVEI